MKPPIIWDNLVEIWDDEASQTIWSPWEDRHFTEPGFDVTKLQQEYAALLASKSTSLTSVNDFLVTLSVTLGRIALFDPPDEIWLQTPTVQWNQELKFAHNYTLVSELFKKGLRYTWNEETECGRIGQLKIEVDDYRSPKTVGIATIWLPHCVDYEFREKQAVEGSAG
ncbi:unnamed protein product, partial [Amoebophrya sp. A120]